jgi:hypothetical protein
VGDLPVTEHSSDSELITVTALPPHNRTSIVFRSAVYTDPGQVRISIPADAGELEIWVSEILPGTQFTVQGAERSWTALLTAVEGGRFTVTESTAHPLGLVGSARLVMQVCQ